MVNLIILKYTSKISLYSTTANYTVPFVFDFKKKLLFSKICLLIYHNVFWSQVSNIESLKSHTNTLIHLTLYHLGRCNRLRGYVRNHGTVRLRMFLAFLFGECVTRNQPRLRFCVTECNREPALITFLRNRA